NFLIVDAGMTELLRPALYQAHHEIRNLSASEGEKSYDVVGPICETSDFFGKEVKLPDSNRGDLMAILSAGAYAEVMASHYNLREKAPALYSTDFE
ncbi:MAG: diaminopimelate decarboxylase, partial [Bacteroidota bacterium]